MRDKYITSEAKQLRPLSVGAQDAFRPSKLFKMGGGAKIKFEAYNDTPFCSHVEAKSQQ